MPPGERCSPPLPNAWSLSSSAAGDALVTSSRAERGALLKAAGGGWKEACNPIPGPSVFCVDTSMKGGRDGPFMLMNAPNATMAALPGPGRPRAAPPMPRHGHEQALPLGTGGLRGPRQGRIGARIYELDERVLDSAGAEEVLQRAQRWWWMVA